jgi:hypothetical protein
MDPPFGGNHHAVRQHSPWAYGVSLALVALLAGALGCGTTRVTNSQRTATEQLLVSNAIDQSVSQLDFRVLANKPVFFDAHYLGASVDQGYVVSSLRQHLLACGCILAEDRSQATYVVEARTGGIGTDLHELLFGVPQLNLPSVLPGQPSLIPEIPFAKKTDQKGVAKILVFAYNRRTGRPVWQSGVVQSDSTLKDTWVLGAGPFRRGTLGEATEFAGQEITIPLLSGKESGKEDAGPVLAVTRTAVWQESPETLELSPYRLTGQSTAAEPAKMAAPAVPSVEFEGDGAPTKKDAPAPRKAGEQTQPYLRMEPIQLPGFSGTGTGVGQPPVKDPGPQKVTSPSTAGSNRQK